MTMSSSFLNELPIIAATITTPLAINCLFRLSRMQKVKARNGLLIFPISYVSRTLGIVVMVGSVIAEYFSLTAITTNYDLWIPLLFFCTGAVGIWMSVGEFTLNRSCIEKRVLWFKKSVQWDQVEEIDETSGGSILYGASIKLWIEPFYADYGHLLQEIHCRAPGIKTRKKSKWKKFFGW